MVFLLIMDKKTRQKWGIVLGFVAAIVYLLIPTDISPDVVPVVGWIDDIVAILLAITNAILLANKIKKQ